MVNALFSEHKFYLHPKVIAKVQVRKLVERVCKRMNISMDKENSSQFNQNSNNMGQAAPTALNKQGSAANNHQHPSKANNWVLEQNDS